MVLIVGIALSGELDDSAARIPEQRSVSSAGSPTAHGRHVAASLHRGLQTLLSRHCLHHATVTSLLAFSKEYTVGRVNSYPSIAKKTVVQDPLRRKTSVRAPSNLKLALDRPAGGLGS